MPLSAERFLGPSLSPKGILSYSLRSGSVVNNTRSSRITQRGLVLTFCAPRSTAHPTVLHTGEVSHPPRNWSQSSLSLRQTLLALTQHSFPLSPLQSELAFVQFSKAMIIDLSARNPIPSFSQPTLKVEAIQFWPITIRGISVLVESFSSLDKKGQRGPAPFLPFLAKSMMLEEVEISF